MNSDKNSLKDAPLIEEPLDVEADDPTRKTVRPDPVSNSRRETLAQQFAPPVAYFALSAVLMTIYYHFEPQWPNSPLFFLVRLTGSLVLAAITLIWGLLQLFVTGSDVILARIPDCFSHELGSLSGPAVVLAIPFLPVLLRIYDQNIPDRKCKVILAWCLIVICIIVVLDEPWGLKSWLVDIDNIDDRLWSWSDASGI